MFIAELDHPDFKKFDLSSLRIGVMAGSPCPIEVMKKLVRVYEKEHSSRVWHLWRDGAECAIIPE